MLKVFSSWSGGKDCSLALYRAKKDGMDVRYLLNTVTQDGMRSCSHGMSAMVIRRQADALGIPIIQRPTTGDNYETVFVDALKKFKQEGIEGGVFGDIDFNPHREWIERVCGGAGISPYLPLWLEDQKKLMEEFIDAGFIAKVVAVKADILGKDVLGRTVDRAFLAYLAGLNRNITPCGEAGEFHTLVINGPIFQQSLEITAFEKVTRGEHHFLEITGLELKAKQPSKR